MTTKRPTLREMRMRRGGALKLSGQGRHGGALRLSGQGRHGGALKLSGQGLSPKEMAMLQKVKALVQRKRQSGAGIADVIPNIVALIEKLGIPITPILWNKFILPIISKTFLSKFSTSSRKDILKFLKIGGGLTLAGAGLTLSGGRHRRKRTVKRKVGRPRKIGGRHRRVGRPRKVGRPRRKVGGRRALTQTQLKKLFAQL